MTVSPALEHLDVLVVGAGLSGIGTAWHLQDRMPGKTYAVLEARERSGGTWDLFRYPGVRSDSDMYTLGYRFRPWTAAKAIADGPNILEYVRDTAREAGIDQHIRFDHKLTSAAWSTAEARWTVDVEHGGETVQLTCGWLLMCSGYYRYDEGFTPDFQGLDDFAGQIIHPQHWPEDADWAGKKVVVIGSGATAVTLVPAMAKTAAKVTMLQRSPSYVLSLPDEDAVANALGRVLPSKISYPIVRWKNVAQATLLFQLSRRAPGQMKKYLRKFVDGQLPDHIDVDTHFKPRYNPWDQRLCLVPNADLFRALRKGTADIATDTIAHFDETGIQLNSGAHLDADIIVTATGLNLLAFGGTTFSVDGKAISLPDTMAYKGMMLTELPNYAYTVGYTNISWTLKADLVSEYVMRLMAYMEKHGYDIAVPSQDDPAVKAVPFLDFAAGYVLRSVDNFPKQGSKKPWKLNMNYTLDLPTLRHGPVDNAMRFSRRSPATAAAEQPATALV